MNVEVGVDPPVMERVSTMVMAIPSSVQVVKGWHARPGKETVTTELRLTDRSITLQNGACHHLHPTTPIDAPQQSRCPRFAVAGSAERSPPDKGQPTTTTDNSHTHWHGGIGRDIAPTDVAAQQGGLRRTQACSLG
jgi:hypothetical protein